MWHVPALTEFLALLENHCAVLLDSNFLYSCHLSLWQCIDIAAALSLLQIFVYFSLSLFLFYLFIFIFFSFFIYRQASCHHYHGHVCSEHLDKNKLLYIKKSPKILEESLRSPFSLLKPRLLKDCAKYALKAICLTTYPYCPSTNKPKPVRLCREECEELQSGVCESDFRVARQFDYLAVILPNCSALPEKGSKEAEGCIKLGLAGEVPTVYVQCFR